MVLQLLIVKDPKVLRITHLTFPESCTTLQDRLIFLKNKENIQEEEKVAMGLVPPPSDAKVYDAMKKTHADEDNAILTVAKRAFNAINIYGRYFPHNAVNFD